MIMGEKKSGGGWLKKIPGLGKKKSIEDAAAGTAAAPPEKKAPAQPAKRMHCNPLMPGQESQGAPQPAATGPESGDKAQQALSDSILVSTIPK